MRYEIDWKAYAPEIGVFLYGSAVILAVSEGGYLPLWKALIILCPCLLAYVGVKKSV